MNMTYHFDINKLDVNDELQSWFEAFIKKNKIKLLYESVILVEYYDYKITISIDADFKAYIKLYKKAKFITLEYTELPDYKYCNKAFLKVLLILKKIIKDK